MKKRYLLAVAGGLWCASLASAQDAAKPASKDPGIAATVNGQPVTTAELDVKVLKTNMKLAQQLYDGRKAALDQIVLDRALAKEAEEKKMTVDQLVSAKVAEKVKPVTDEDVKAYFDANQGRMQGKTLEQSSGQIKGFLASQRESEAKNNLLADVRKSANVKILMDVPRAEIAVAPNDPVKGGGKDAKVTVIEFSDFQ
jgi:hypothetical protein